MVFNELYVTTCSCISLSVPPSCPTSFSANRDGDFTSTVATYQLATPPPVTSTTITYCPTSSPNCGNSMNCTSPCTISGLDPCVEYNLSAIPNNNCGSPTGCTGNSMVVPAKGQCSYITQKTASFIANVFLHIISTLSLCILIFARINTDLCMYLDNTSFTVLLMITCRCSFMSLKCGSCCT